MPCDQGLRGQVLLSKYIVNISCESAVFETDAGRLLPLVDHEVALSSQSVGPPPQQRGAGARRTSKPTDTKPQAAVAVSG